MMAKYKIKQCGDGFLVKYRPWWLPFYIGAGFFNFGQTRERAHEIARDHAKLRDKIPAEYLTIADGGAK